MAHYFLKRILTVIPVFFGITVLVFLFLCATPASIADLAGAGGESTQSGDREVLTETLGLGQPLPVRYIRWLRGLLQGDLGISYRSGQPVSTLISQRFLPSLLLTGTGVFMAVVLAIPLGVLSAWKPGTRMERAISGFAMTGAAVPGFFLALVAIYLFAIKLKWLPAFSMFGGGAVKSAGDFLRQILLPALVICISNVGGLLKQTRSACLEVLGEDYITTARAKGVKELAVVVRHGLRSALIPVLTAILTHIPHIIGGSVVVEQIFGWPGMGSLMFSAINSRDYNVIMGVTVVIALAVLGTSMILDLVYGLVDPRIRYEEL
ncbi:MAG: ABC transporter permease [Clostridia bacterium]|nr:ABC transporter permease [Clostridia bacterium]